MAHSHTHPPRALSPALKRTNALLCSGWVRLLSAGTVCGVLWLALFWAMNAG